MLPAALLLAGAAGPIALSPGGASAPATAVHSVANISDPMSHGTVGDGYLSLNEAILLHNRQLQISQLSAAEQAQLSGAGVDISWINIDASWTPTITVERDFDLILDFAHGILIQGFNGSPIIDFSNPTLQFGFRSVSNYCSWRNLILQGGRFGIDLQQTDASFGGTVVDNVEFDGQAQFAFAVAGTTPGQYGRVLFDRCAFRNTPIAIRDDETPDGRTTVLVVFDSEFAVGQDAIDITLGSNGQSLYEFDRVHIDAVGKAVDIARAGAGRSIQLSITHLAAVAASCLHLQGDPVGTSAVTLRMLDLQATPGGSALNVEPLGADFTGVLEDSKLTGDCAVLCGGGAAALSLANCRFANGNITLGSNLPEPLACSLNRFTACTLSTAGQQPLQAFGCSLEGGSVQGSVQAPVQFTLSHVGAAVGANVAQNVPLPAPHLASFAAQPHDPVLGGSVNITSDLPNGLFAFYLVGPVLDPPAIFAPPLHIYLDLAEGTLLPGVYRLQQGLSVAIPNAVLLEGTQWVIQAAVFRDPTTLAADLQVPPGHRFVIR